MSSPKQQKNWLEMHWEMDDELFREYEALGPNEYFRKLETEGSALANQLKLPVSQPTRR